MPTLHLPTSATVMLAPALGAGFDGGLRLTPFGLVARAAQGQDPHPIPFARKDDLP